MLLRDTVYHERGKLIHGYECRKHPLYNTWFTMLQRCYNPDVDYYANYGGCGITVCDTWLNSFEAFALDMGLKPEPSLTLERIDNSKGYSKDNCKWATRTEQCLNRRTFKNNTSGETGVVKIKGSYNARYDESGVRYNLGKFSSLEEAVEFRSKFVELLHTDKANAMLMLERRARLDSSTKIKGTTQNKDGFLVRVTDKGERIYLGFSKTLDGAIEILNHWKETGDATRKY